MAASRSGYSTTAKRPASAPPFAAHQALYLPLRGVSAIDVDGAPFADRAADEALFAAVRGGLAPHVELHELDTDINDPEFARAMAARLDEFLTGSTIGDIA